MSVRIDRALEAFRRGMRVPFREDAAWLGDLADEARPLLEALDFAIATAGGDPLTVEYREGLALAALLGRRAALRGMTPTAALAVVDALAAALREMDRAPPPATLQALRSVVVEGFCAAVEERVRDDVARRSAASIVPQRIAPGVWALLVAGDHDPERLHDALERAARALLDVDVRACLVHVALATVPCEDVAAEIFGFDVSIRMVGGRCVFSGVGPEWRALARHPDHLLLAESLEDGLRRALEMAGAEIRVTPPLLARMRRLVARLGPRAGRSMSVRS